MQYGHFDDEHREYVITDPATPFPWINYLGNEDFFSLISNTAGGYSFYKDAKFRRITRYRYNGVPMDNGGRYFYIKDGDTVWNPGWKPCKTPLDAYECRHGMNYTRITGQKNGVTCSLLFFVPLHTWAEVQRLTLTNHSNETKKLQLFSLAEWCLWNAATDMENFQRNWSTGEVEIDGSVIYHKTEYKERRNHYAYYSVNCPINGYDTDRESFIGLYNDFSEPQRVMEGQAGNSLAHGWSPIASHCIEVTLQPGESRDLIFLLGYVENPQEEKFDDNELIRKQDGTLITSQASDRTLLNKHRAQETINRLSTVEAVDKAFLELRQMWDELLDKYTVQSGDERLDRMVNIWNQYQCMITFNFSRSASFFESGIGRGMGFRDSNYTKICPAWIEDQKLHKVEPYVYCQMVAGWDAARPGEGKNSWLTGTAAWNWITITQHILGIQPTYDGLLIDPCIPSHLHEYTVHRTLRGSRYTIHVTNPDGRQHGVRSITLDCTPITGNTIVHSKGDHMVEVIM